MEFSSTYEAYKRDTKHLTQWMIRSTNEIIQSSSKKPQDLVVSENGETTVASLLSMSHLLGERVGSIPPTIFRLLRYTIDARSAMHRYFLNLNTLNPDPAVEASNATHRVFIDSLKSVFRNLGGDSWLANEKLKYDYFRISSKVEAPAPSNSFNVLQLGDVDDTQIDGHEALGSLLLDPNKSQQSEKDSEKNKKGKRKKTRVSAKTPTENCRITIDGYDRETEYKLVVDDLIHTWTDLRLHLQGIWKSVAYDGKNSAIASSGSLVAIGLIRRSVSAIFVDFPDHDSYYTMIKTVTGREFTCTGQRGPSKIASAVREQMLIPTYEALMEFLHDFRQKRDRGPSKGMMKKLRKWNPRLDLVRATEQQRLDWRRLYTIKWLYDMVNICSSPFFDLENKKSIEMKGIEDFDWSSSGPFSNKPRLYGLNGFAGEITHVAFQRPSTDVRPMILPHHIFQLQCIVDSFTVSKGWSFGSAHESVLEPPARDFQVKRDLEIFLGVCLKRGGLYGNGSTGFYIDGNTLFGMLEGHPGQTKCLSYRLMWALLCCVLHGLRPLMSAFCGKKVAPSCFVDSEVFGFWDYSPFLCGVGLLSAVELSYGTGQRMLDTLHEPVGILRIHSALLQKGYLKEPVNFVHKLQKMFQESIFYGSEVPVSHFEQSLRSFQEAGAPPSSWEDSCNPRTWETLLKGRKPDPILSLQFVTRLEHNKYFRTEVGLVQLSKANWQMSSLLTGGSNISLGRALDHRGHAKDAVERADGKIRDIFDPSGQLAPRGAHKHANKGRTWRAEERRKDWVSGREFVDNVMTHISDEFWGPLPMSGVNYMSVVRDLLLFHTKLDCALGKYVFPANTRDYGTAIDFTYRVLDRIEHANTESDHRFITELVSMFGTGDIDLSQKCYWRKTL